jgi:site-specific DNA-methyltransferase (adenine-specific)
MTVKELRAKAKAAGIKGYSKMRKAELESAMYDAADNSAKSYDVAIISMRDKLASFRKEVIGECTLYLGDCREIAPLLSGIDCVVTSPPYNQLDGIANAAPSGIWATSFGAGFVNAWKANGYADAIDEPTYQADQRALFATIARACKPTASLFYNHQIRWRDGEMLHPIAWFTPDDWRLRAEVIWDRAGGMMFNARMFCRFDERVIWFVRGNHWKWNQGSVGLGTVWRIQAEKNKDHPVAFPLEIPRRCIEATTDSGDVVMDPFMGSATTGVAALKLGRRFIGIEREEKYFDIACRRIEEAYRQPDMFVAAPRPAAEQLALIAAE